MLINLKIYLLWNQMEFTCSICNYKSELKSNVKNHIKNQKTPCGEGIHEIIEISVIIKCEYCEKNYKSRPSLRRHLKSCKMKKSTEAQQKIAELEAKLAEKPQPQTVNNYTTYIQVNVNCYSETSFEHLTDRQYQRAVKRMIYSVPQMIQDVHFDPKVPENHNIYISNIKNKYAMVWDGNKWCSKPQDQVINQLINDQEYAIEDWLGEGDNFPKEMQKFNEYLEKKEQSQKSDEIKDVIKEEVKLLLYNNRNIIKNRP